MSGAPASGTAAPLLEVRGLEVRYRAAARSRKAFEAVRGVDLDIGPGEIVALVGESGSGKTSLAQAVLRLVAPAAGSIRFEGEDLLALRGPRERAARRHIQAVFQDPLASLSPRRTVEQSVREPLDHFRIGAPGERAARVTEALQSVGLDQDLAGRYPQELSGGQRQRVALARAIAPRPRLIVADEPVSSLDLAVQQRVLKLIRELRERTGVAFLFISHDLAVVRRLADRVAVMVLGHVVESGPTAAVFRNPAHPYTRSLLDAVPAPDPARPPPRVPAGEPASPLTPPAGCVFHSRCEAALPICETQPPQEQEPRGQGPAEAGHRVSCHLWTR